MHITSISAALAAAVLLAGRLACCEEASLPVEEEREAAAAITELGGWYELGDSGHVIEVNMVYHDPPNAPRTDNDNLSDRALAYIPQFTQLERLFLKETQATDQALQFLADARTLRRLYMWDAIGVSDEGVRHLAALENLEYIHLSRSRIGDESLRILSGLPRLSECVLQQNQFTDEGLRHIARAHQIQSLWIGLGDTHITDAGTVHLSGLTQLEELDLQGCQLTDKGIEPLLTLTSLRALNLGSGKAPCEITDDALKRLAESLPDLERLSLRSSKLSDAGLTHLARLQHLTSLSLSGFVVSDRGALALLPLENLEALTLSGQPNEISDGAIHQFVARLRNLERLWIAGIYITDTGLGYLYDLPKLRSLSIKSSQVTEEAMARFRAARPGVTAYVYE